ncbi:MAG TPA: hypothetical protein VJX47_00690 [Candidatus Sulfotelmatobacter sp.]|nr:hypothetical protein [Candidatus Sulfotelmatobacter sp.]
MRQKVKVNRRQQNRIQGVLPVRVRGRDASGALFEELAHTLDLTATGARLGAIRHKLKTLDTLVVLFRQRRVEFSVVWTRLLDERGEHQVGLEMVAQESDPWGLGVSHADMQPGAHASAVSGAA